MWYYMRGAEQVGPISNDDLRTLITSTAIVASTPVWKEGMPNWQQAGSLPELAPIFEMFFGAALPPAAANVSVSIPDYLIWAILETVCCCQPFGIVGIIFSIQANSAKKFGNVNEAMAKSKTAKKFLIWGAILGGLTYLVAFGVNFFVAIANNR